jgi:hypothetical protein
VGSVVCKLRNYKRAKNSKNGWESSVGLQILKAIDDDDTIFSVTLIFDGDIIVS